MAASPNPASPLIIWLANRATVGIVAAWIVTVVGFAGPLHWFADAMNHPRWHLAWLCGLAALVCWRAGMPRWMFAALTCTIVLVICTRPWAWYLPTGSDGGGDVTTRVMYWNINAGNRDTGTIIATINQYDPDVVALLELNHAHLPGLADLRRSHPHFRENAGGDAFGLGVYSKHPVEWKEVASEPPVIRGLIKVRAASGLARSNDETEHHADLINFWAVHTLPPIGAANLEARNRQMVRLAKQIVAPDRTRFATIVGGDFNITPWCREFRSFARNAGLADSRLGHGYQATWPSKLGTLGIPIDHVLVDPATTVINRRVVRGQAVSDHAAVIVDLHHGSHSRPQ